MENIEYSFIQLVNYHLSQVPLPKNPDGICRECGGPLETQKSVLGIPKIATKKLNVGKYGDTWVDEGLIAFRDSQYVCPACALAQGNAARVMIMPYPGCVMWTSLTRCFPHLEKPVDWSDQNITRASLYPESQTLADFLHNLPEPPFGLVIGSGADNKKHFMRHVPLSYGTKQISAIMMGGHEYVSFRSAPLSSALDLAIAEDIANIKNYKERNEKLAQISEKFILREQEKILLRRGLFPYEQKNKEKVGIV